jgi:uncharacterized protein YkwD
MRRVQADEGVVRTVQSPHPMARHRTLCIVAASVACSLVLAATASACAGSRSRPSPTSLERAMRATVCLINQARGHHGLGALRTTGSLARAATAHSRDMVVQGFFAHDSPTGSTPKQRIDRAGYFDGAPSWALGETIAWGRGGSATPGAIVRSWLRSPGHRAILLDGRYRDLGIGIAVGAPGQGGGATFTGDFGARG